MYVFPKRCDGADTLKYIFRLCKRGAESDRGNKNIDCIRRITIFGSAVTMNCGIGSDLDIAVDAPDITDEDEFIQIIRPIRRAVCVDADIIHLNGIKISCC